MKIFLTSSLLRKAGKLTAKTMAVSLLLFASVINPMSVMATSGSGFDQTRPATVGKVLPNDWLISPAGQQVEVGNLPTNGIISPDGQYLAVTNNGCSTKTQELSIIDLKSGKKVDSAEVTASFIGLAFSKDGKTLYLSGGNDKKVYVYSLENGKLTSAGSIPVPGYPAGMALLPNSNLAVAENILDKVALVDTQAEKVTAEIPVGRYPYWITPSQDGKFLFVSNWGSDSVSKVDLSNSSEIEHYSVGKLPEAMVMSNDGSKLYVTNTNSDSVSVIDTATGSNAQTIDVHFYGLPTGAAPTGLALSPDNTRLFVSLAGVNAVAVVNTVNGLVNGYIPAAWYPTAVLYNTGLKQVIVLNGKGAGLGPDIDGPKPGTDAPNQSQYDYAMITGTVSLVPDPDTQQLKDMTTQVMNNALNGVAESVGGTGNPIPRYVGGTSPIKHVFFIVRENRTYDQDFGDIKGANGDPSLVQFGKDITPNAHKLADQFVTMDNYYADAEVSVQGHAWTAGAYSTDYVEKTTALLYSGRYPHYDGGVVPIAYPPNGFIWKNLADNQISYKVYGENYYLHSGLYYLLTSILGSNDHLVTEYYKFLRQADGRDGTGIMGKFFERFKSYADIQSPAQLASLLKNDDSFRTDLSTILTGDIYLADYMNNNPLLLNAVADYLSHYQFDYRGWDLKYSDIDRATAFNGDFDREMASGDVPTFNYIWLPNDHTAGVKDGYLLPKELVAQNDTALGMIVEKISQSSLWKDSAIFVTEDDAQNGSDHVDAHRTVGLVISPYVKHGTINHTHYDQMSMLRTMELIAGLKPMSMFDASALPMYDIFTNNPDVQSFAAVQDNAKVSAQSLKTGYNFAGLSTMSANLDLSQADVEGQDDLLNKILWENIKGTPYKPLNKEDDD